MLCTCMSVNVNSVHKKLAHSTNVVVRLLSTVKVGEKMEGSKQEMRHHVEAIPGKLSSQTKNE